MALHAKIALLMAVAVLLLGCSASNSKPASEPASPDLATPVLAKAKVGAEGRLAPRRSAQLSFVGGGAVVEMGAVEGEVVQQGQILMRLDDAQQRAAADQATAALQAAEADLASVLAGARSEEIAQAETGVTAARANVVVVALQLESAAEAVNLAQAQVEQAEAGRDDLAAGATVQEREIAERQVNMARNEFWAAQAGRDAVAGAKDAGHAKGYDVDQAEAVLGVAYEAQQIAEADLARVLAGARPGALAAADAGIQIAQAQVTQAQAQLAVAQGQLEVANASHEGALAQVALVRAGPTDEDVARTEAGVAQAKAALEAARVPGEQTLLRAPFTGLVVSISPKLGEQVGPGIPVLQMADLTRWYVETGDLTEMEVVRISVGQQATMVPDALPELEIGGTVESIRQVSEIKQGDTTYLTRILVEDVDDRMRWGMNVFVTFEN